jgi:hypothetical protein
MRRKDRDGYCGVRGLVSVIGGVLDSVAPIMVFLFEGTLGRFCENKIDMRYCVSCVWWMLLAVCIDTGFPKASGRSPEGLPA